MKLSQAELNKSYIIVKVSGYGSYRRRIIEMGFVKGKKITPLQDSPFKGPVVYELMDSKVSIRRSEAEMVEIIPVEEAEFVPNDVVSSVGVDKEPKFIAKDSKQIKVALVGNPNSGKSSLYNRLTGKRAKIGNYSGVTVEMTSTTIEYEGYSITITDLPGVYSMSSYSPEEKVALDFIANETPDVIINTVVASNLERNLFLTTQLIDMDLKIVVALNMYDELQENNDTLNHDALAKLMGVSIVPTSALENKGIRDLASSVVDAYEDKSDSIRHIHINYGQDVEKAITEIRKELSVCETISARVSGRFVALELLSKDSKMADFLKNDGCYEKIMSVVGSEYDKVKGACPNGDVNNYISDMRYAFIAGALRETYKHNEKLRIQEKSSRIDKILLHKAWGFPILALIMGLVFLLTFTLGAYPMSLIESGMGMIGDFIAKTMSDGILKDFLVDGVIGGIEGVLVFVPNIAILFMCLSFLEDSGYIARTSFIMDKTMHSLGLHGNSFISLVMGFGCNVPAIMSTRTIRSRKGRLLTMLVIPFMSCTARLPVYMLIIYTVFSPMLTNYFSPHFSAATASILTSLSMGCLVVALYLGGLILAFVTAKLLNKFFLKSKDLPFVMELPPYRKPLLGNVLRYTWDKTWIYIRKIATVVLVAVTIVWALDYFPRPSESNIAADGTEIEHMSYMNKLGRTMQPIFEPMGFDDNITVALLSGVVAKEVVVSTMGVLYKVDDGDDEGLRARLAESTHDTGRLKGEKVFTPQSSIALLVFVLIYFPCISVIITIVKEAGLKYALFAAGYTTILAWILSYLSYLITLWIVA
ncbi:MAG: ferrous iron transport protein B [Bacteroidales bacterium]